MAAPEPREWLAAYSRVQRLADRDVLALLNIAYRDITKTLKVLDLSTNVSDLVRAQQLRMIQREMLREQATIWRYLGDIIRARRLEAAAAAAEMGSAVDSVLFQAAGSEAQARALRSSLVASSQQTVEVFVARVTLSQVPLAERIYKSNVWVNQRVQTMINSALARGLSAAEFAKEARSWFNPNVPGGTRYAAMRLARTEINNAFHATSVMQAVDKPWVNGMQWHLSRSHPKVDICDALAKGGPKGDGVYAPRNVPAKPHPQDLCYVTPVTEDEDTFLDNLVAGHYDDYIDSKVMGF